jgi:hypothetical protein
MLDNCDEDASLVQSGQGRHPCVIESHEEWQDRRQMHQKIVVKMKAQSDLID